MAGIIQEAGDFRIRFSHEKRTVPGTQASMYWTIQHSVHFLNDQIYSSFNHLMPINKEAVSEYGRNRSCRETEDF